MTSHVSANDLAAFIWDIADLLRGRYKPSEYGKVILPFTVLRRLDCVLEATKPDVLKEYALRTKEGKDNLDPFLTRKAKLSFYNTYPQSLPALLDDAGHVRQNLDAYVAAFSENTRDIFERFKFSALVQELHGHNLLYKVLQKFAAVDLHPNVISNHDMGHVFENLIYRFSESSNVSSLNSGARFL
jgi:type I restriction enzyme M protein